MNVQYEELLQMNRENESERLKGAAIVMERFHDKEMADTLRLLSSQLDFDDNLQASGAIQRTRDKLDKMIEDRQSRRADLYTPVLTDEDILMVSGGEVTEYAFSRENSSFYKNGLFDPDIFGGSGEIPILKEEHIQTSSFGKGIGHMSFPCRVLKKDDYDIVGHLLHMKKDDVRSVVKYGTLVVLDPGTSDYKRGDVISEKEYYEVRKEHDVTADLGADALYVLLKDLGYQDHPERLAFNVLPVISPAARPLNYIEEDDLFLLDPINSNYSRVLSRVNRLKRLMEDHAPEIILRNEKRMLSDYVDILYEDASQQVRKYIKKPFGKRGFWYLSQLSLITARKNDISMELGPFPKTCDIKSLNLYPSTIQLKNEDGTLEPIDIADVMEENDNALVTYMSNSTSNSNPNMEEEIDNLADSIWQGAKEQREKFTVVYDNEKGVYIPA